MVDSTLAYSSTKCWLTSNQPVFTVPIFCPLLCQVENNIQKYIKSLSRNVEDAFCSLKGTFVYSFTFH